MRSKLYIPSLFLGTLLLGTACKKLVQIPPPVNSITTTLTFNDTANATSAMIGLYSHMSHPVGAQSLKYATGGTSINCGMSADELYLYGSSYGYEINVLLPNGGSGSDPNPDFWIPMYTDIYSANAIIEGVQASTKLTSAFKSQLTGEAECIRAFDYFYLVNLFGDVPLVTTTAFAKTATLKRTPSALIYQRITTDLVDAQNKLPTDYSISGGERTRVNKWVAISLLARVYLYQKLWKDAETQASAVISNSSEFLLASDLNQVFLRNNNEAIWQLQLIDQPPYATYDGNQIIPYDNTSSPNYTMTTQLLAAFEPGDKRRTAWVDSTFYNGTYYYYPFKYKVRQGTQGGETEAYTLLRLAEQFLIRAEARAQQGNLMGPDGAISDLNIIRARAGLPDLPQNLNQNQVLAAVAQERRVEFFEEWGHRWLDLKRTGQANAVLAPIKSQWKPTAQLYPIPLVEQQVDPNLTQNPGY